jgi:hypothetical protein
MTHKNINTVSPRDEKLAQIKMNDQGENDMDIQRK